METGAQKALVKHSKKTDEYGTNGADAEMWA